MHDAVLICAPLDRLDADVDKTRDAHGRGVADRARWLRARHRCNVVKYPDRYMDPRGAVMWDRVMGLITERQSASMHRVLVA